MTGPILRALDQLPDPRFRWTLVKAIGLTLAILIGVYAVVGTLIAGIDPFTLPFIGLVDPGLWLAGLAVGALMLASIFLMIPVAALCIGFFLDDIAGAVEDRHYPHLPPADPPGLIATVIDALGFFGVLIAANIVALAIYLLVAPLAPFIFYIVNGYLLGREYFQLVALRRMPPAEAKRFRRANRGRIWIMGIAMAVPLSIPILNLVVPLVGVAAYTHLFHELRGRVSTPAR
ncbi:EI24 domain-containing protein [Roseobacter sp. HKCCA0434]|uniref:EI24 domain-containing protein n=1 Tax=Roseobacter sp. HKCCA0434 TaxID=3079297 RepID=UPI002905D560|nr:EI24 domain-containing protein [Roseobacter sp. HKCCA0434]